MRQIRTSSATLALWTSTGPNSRHFLARRSRPLRNGWVISLSGSVEDHEAARLRGHSISPGALNQLRAYEDAALLLREAHDLPISRGN